MLSVYTDWLLKEAKLVAHLYICKYLVFGKLQNEAVHQVNKNNNNIKKTP